VVVDFVLPDVEQRRLLWQLHLPLTQAVEEGFQERAVQRCKLTGGQIRNTALHAGLLALHDKRPVSAADLSEALQREYRKAGHPYPLSGTNGRG
jgi:ATP-dependent 26S proteasome regulatory subunit